MKIIVNLLVKKDVSNPEDIKQYVEAIKEYIWHIDKLYIYNITKYPLTAFYEALSKYDNIECTTCDDLGEVLNYERMYNLGLRNGADFVVNLELGYYFEESVFNTIKSYISDNDVSKIAILTPTPLLGCQLFEHKAEEVRYVMGGCNLVGTFVNMEIYEQMNGFKKEYYQSMFDYEYCIRVRQKGYKILLFNNLVLRNNNYQIIEKRFGFVTLSTYNKDPLDIYYEYRNRLYLWQEYKRIDPYYVKIDKKLAKAERHEMKMRDPNYRDKLVMFEKAKSDFTDGITGKIKYRKRELHN